MHTGISKKQHKSRNITSGCIFVKYILFPITILVCIYNDDILYKIYYNNTLYCYVAENRTLILNKANILNKNIIKTVPVLTPTSLKILTNTLFARFCA